MSVLKFGKRNDRFTDEELAEACLALLDYEISLLPPPEACKYEDSETYTAYMDDLLAKVKDNRITPATVRMGWQYYARKGLAAALIAALLTSVAMPEAVMAGYKWLIEVVERFFEDRTEYVYNSNVETDTEFVPMKFGYMPEGMVESYRKEGDGKIRSLYIRENEFFEIAQRKMADDLEWTHGSNTEIYYTECIIVNNIIVKLIEEKGRIDFSFVTDVYHVTGQTNLSKEAFIKILTNIEFE